MSFLYHNGNVLLTVVLFHLPAGHTGRSIECAPQSQNRSCHSNIIQNSSTFNFFVLLTHQQRLSVPQTCCGTSKRLGSVHKTSRLPQHNKHAVIDTRCACPCQVLSLRTSKQNKCSQRTRTHFNIFVIGNFELNVESGAAVSIPVVWIRGFSKSPEPHTKPHESIDPPFSQKSGHQSDIRIRQHFADEIMPWKARQGWSVQHKRCLDGIRRWRMLPRCRSD